MLRRRKITRLPVPCLPVVNPLCCQPESPQQGLLRLMSFNIQVGNNVSCYSHYLTRSWQHLLPYAERERNLQRIADLLNRFDLVALQEVDGGSLRSRGINQVEFLARQGNFPYWHQQLNRNIGAIAQHSNGLLSRLRPTSIEDHPLPGPKGRGAILARFGQGESALAVVMMHLALGKKTRNAQLDYIRRLIQDYHYYVLMGDMNTSIIHLLQQSPLAQIELIAPQSKATFPSWAPRRALDHILISPNLTVREVQVYNQIVISDHLPVAVEIALPGDIVTGLCAPFANIAPIAGIMPP